MPRLIVLGLAAALVGCASGAGVELRYADADRIALSYDQLVASPAKARDRAQRYCRGRGKHAVLLSNQPAVEGGWGTRVLTFACRT